MKDCIWLDILSKKMYQGVEGDEKEVAVLCWQNVQEVRKILV
jgi:hypothetical protein